MARAYALEAAPSEPVCCPLVYGGHADGRLTQPAALDDVARVEDEDLVGVGDRGEPVREDESRASLAQPVERA